MLSFHAPYKCARCNHRFKALIDVYVHRDAIANRVPPTLTCPKCGEAAGAYEGTAEQFANLAAAVSPPGGGDGQSRPLREAMDPGSPQLSRHVEGETTRLVLVGEMATSVRWRSAMEGLGNDLVVDLTRVSVVSGGGVSPLVTALQGASASVSGMLVIGCPLPVAHALRANPIAGLKFKSVSVDAVCGHCSKKSKILVELGGGPLEAALAKPMSCPHCKSKIAPKADQVKSRTIPLGALLTIAAVIALIGLVVVVAGVVLAGVEGIGRDDDTMGTAGVEDRLDVGTDKVSAVGHGGPYGTVAEAEAAARDKALGAIVSAIAREIATKRGTSGGAIEVAPSAVQRFVDAVGLDPASLVAQSDVKEGEGGFEVDAKYALPRDKFDEIATAYAEERDWGPLRLVRPFPPAPGLRVVKSSLDGVEPGTRVVRVGEDALNTFAQLPPDAPGLVVVAQDPDGTERSVTLP